MSQGNFIRKTPITKMALYLRAMRMALWVTIAFGALMTLMSLFSDAGAGSDPLSTLWFIFSTTFAFFIFLILAMSPIILTELYLIKKQEKHFGFNFNDDMKLHDIRNFAHMDENWFILVSGSRVYAYRKGFITDFGTQSNSIFSRKMSSRVVVACADGKARIIMGTSANLTALEEWVQSTVT